MGTCFSRTGIRGDGGADQPSAIDVVHSDPWVEETRVSSVNPSKRFVLTIIRGSQPDKISNARMINHVDFWDEYSFEDPPVVLGMGISGPVYRIQSRRSPTMKYALKRLPVTSPFTLAEVSIYLEIDHPNIAKIFEVYHAKDEQDGGMLFLVTELCNGGDLYSLLKRERHMNEIVAVDMTRQILRAVHYLNSINIVHGDIKLENFVFATSSSGRRSINLKLIDFGFSAKLEFKEPGQDKRIIPAGQYKGGVFVAADSAARTVAVCGSPLYVAPETARGERSLKSDVWSVGVMVFMMLFGKSPFRGTTFEQVIGDIDANRDELIAWILSGENKVKVSKDAIDFIDKCLTVDPEDRISAHEALSHKWITSLSPKRGQNVKESDLDMCRSLILEFASYGPLKRACLCLIALHAPPIKIFPQIENVFDFVDANGNGYIEEDDLRTLFGPNMEKDLFAKLDLTQDNRINFSEFLAATEVNRALQMMEPAFLVPGVPMDRGVSGVDVTGSLRRPSAMPGVPPGLVKIYEGIVDSVFRKLDVDNTSKISHANLRNLFGRRGYQGSKVPDMIKEADYTGDGVIGKEEFFTMLFSSTSALHLSTSNVN